MHTRVNSSIQGYTGGDSEGSIVVYYVYSSNDAYVCIC